MTRTPPTLLATSIELLTTNPSQLYHATTGTDRCEYFPFSDFHDRKWLQLSPALADTSLRDASTMSWNEGEAAADNWNDGGENDGFTNGDTGGAVGGFGATDGGAGGGGEVGADFTCRK